VRVALLATCLVDGLFPDVGKATVGLLERLGHRVEVPPDQTCCGQMHINTGHVREALPLVRRHVAVFEALAAAGIAAWETDLAELIVQLGHDTPSHILVPAIHRNRAEIREIFLHEMGKVGLPAPAGLGDDPRALAEAARLLLRRKFLQAEVAVSGANFAVAETGTLAVVESEGNGRMCLTLPRVLITVMGIEKLLPAPEQALMTSAAWAMASPGRWARALRAARLGRLLVGRRRRIAALQERRARRVWSPRTFPRGGRGRRQGWRSSAIGRP
jgi:hypothetical protein